MEVKIRKLDDDDLIECARIFIDAFEQAPWHEHWDAAQALDRLNHFLSSSQSIGLAAAADGRLRGFLIGEIEQWKDSLHFHLKELCIEPGFQRQGIGRALMEKLSEALRQVGVARIYLITGRSGIPQNFYAALGFSIHEGLMVMGKSVSSG